ncbi:MAG: amidohydrolase [Verrucomicrobiota bacterium]
MIMNRFKRIWIPLLAGALSVAPAFADGSVNEAIGNGLKAAAAAPVTIYTAGKIVTMEPANPVATAVAVRGDRIVAAGSLDEVKAALGGTNYVVDSTFAARVLLPGFIDQHLHPILGALTLSTEVIAPEAWVLPERTFPAAGTPAEYFARLRAAEASMTNRTDWLFSWGYHELWHGKLDRATLDGISATRPIMVWQRSCHEFYLNSAAIRALGLTEQSMQGHGDASRMFNWAEGHWWETGMNLIITPLLGVFATPQRFEFGLKQMIAYEHSKGVTAYCEPGALVTPDLLKLYHQILGADDTPFYSFFIVDGRGYIDRGVPAAAALADGEQIIRDNAAGKVAFLPRQIKLFADGAIISQLMQMKTPYLGADGKPDPSHHGEWMTTPTNLEERSRVYWDAGYQIHVHVNGDEGLEVLLDILECRMRENPRPNHRTVIVHFANSSEEQVARIARLGAIVSANPYYPVGFADKYSVVGLGPERADSMVRSASVVKRHIPLSFHSDLPMAPSDPLFLAWCAVNRVTPSGRVAAPEQRISIEDALRGITIEAAWSWQKENELGSIAPGKIANFTVLEQDPMTVDPMKLKDIPIWGTVFEGRLFPIAKNTAGSAGAPSSWNATATPAGLPLPPCFAPGAANAGGEDHCGACSFNRLLARNGLPHLGPARH